MPTVVVGGNQGKGGGLWQAAALMLLGSLLTVGGLSILSKDVAPVGTVADTAAAVVDDGTLRAVNARDTVYSVVSGANLVWRAGEDVYLASEAGQQMLTHQWSTGFEGVTNAPGYSMENHVVRQPDTWVPAWVPNWIQVPGE